MLRGNLQLLASCNLKINGRSIQLYFELFQILFFQFVREYEIVRRVVVVQPAVIDHQLQIRHDHFTCDIIALLNAFFNRTQVCY